VRWARELADLVALEVSLTWTRLLWLNVLVLVPLALSAYPASYELLNPTARIRNLSTVGVAAVISSQALHVLVAATRSISWARALERGVLGNVLTLPVSRRSAFAAKFLTSVSIPTAALRSRTYGASYTFLGLERPALLVPVLPLREPRSTSPLGAAQLTWPCSGAQPRWQSTGT